jgi:hypothetical protein
MIILNDATDLDNWKIDGKADSEFEGRKGAAASRSG